MSNSASKRKYILTLLICLLSACSSMQVVDVGSAMRNAPPPGLEIGSLVEVETLDERKMKFRVTELSQWGLTGKYGFVAYEDIARLKVEAHTRNEGRVTGYILSTLGIVALIALIDSADSVRICSSPPCE